MNRTLRNGMAVAGMAGGIFFLGQAVASADGHVTQANGNTSGQASDSQVQGSGGDSGAGNLNVNLQGNAADVSTTIVNAPDQSTGSVSNGVSVTLPANAPAEVKIEDVTINQSGTTGSNYANQTVTDLPSPTVTQTNTNTTTQVAESESEKGRSGNHNNNSGPSTLSGGGGGGGSESGAGNVNLNGQLNLVDGSTTIINRPDQTTGSVTNTVNLDFSNATFWCGSEMVDLKSDGPRKCEYTIKIQDVVINQSGTTGSNYANQTIGSPAAPAPAPVHQAKPAQQPQHKAAAPAHQAKRAAPAANRAPMSTTAQPKGSLAYTGAETTAPLALGLLALGAGGALTLAGRRRSTTATV